MLRDLVAGTADRRSDGGPEFGGRGARTSEGLDRRGDDAVEHASSSGVHSRHQRAILRGEQEGHTIGHKDATAGWSPRLTYIQNERVSGGSPFSLGNRHDTGVDLVHPGQVLSLPEPQQLLEPTTVLMNAPGVVTDVERKVPSAVGADRIAALRLRLRAAFTPTGHGAALLAASGEVPTSPRPQIHLDQV